MSRGRLNVITVGIMLSLFLASMEGTVVATAMPTIVGQLGGLSIYSWVFSLYMLASTTTVPIYGKLSDILGRKSVYVVSMLMFLVGSVLCGLAETMEQLIFFRAVQGLGAGGVLPMAFTIVGELFTLEQRAKIQGLFSGVWGVSSIIGPLIGGFLVDQVSWKWVFFINVFPGLLAAGLVWFAWGHESKTERLRAPADYAGASLLTLWALALLLGLSEPGTGMSWALLGASTLLFAGLLRVERRAVDPILPLDMFRDRLFTVSILHGILAGWAMFGSLNYVPLFVQAVLGTSATQAGITLTPMSLSWTFASIIVGRMLLRVSYRTLTLFGMLLLTIGAFLMTRIDASTSQWWIMAYLSMMGAGMGFSIPSLLIAVQSTTPRERLGVATSTVQFSRSIGGTFGVGILGAVLGARFSASLRSAGLDPLSVPLDALLDPVSGASAALAEPVRQGLAVSIATLFWIAFIVSLLGLIVVMLAPPGRISELVSERVSKASEAKRV